MTLALLAVVSIPFSAVFVAPGGDDSAPGTSSNPVASLARAVLIAKPGDTVVVREGDYRISTPVNVGADRAGLRILGEGRVVLRGGPQVPHSLWKRAEDDRLPDSSKGHVFRVDLRAIGVNNVPPLQPRGFSHNGSMAPVELFVGDVPQTLARWPNEGYVKTGRLIDGGSVPREGDSAGRKPVFEFTNERPQRWNGAKDAWAYGYWHYDWADESMPVSEIDGDKVTLGAPHTYGVLADRNFYFENVIEELDSPGEYYIDRRQGALYFWPSKDGDAYLSINDGYLLRVIDGSGVTIENLRFETTRATPVEIAGGHDTTVKNCVFRNIGLFGVKIGSGTGHRVESCRFTDSGEGGVQLYGGDRATLTPANDVVEGSLFERFSRRARTYRPGVLVNGVGMTVSNCEFREAPHSAIIFSGNDHTFVGNSFHDILTETGDGGAIYGGRDWSARGTVIKENLFYRLNGVHLYENGVYLDDQLSGITVEHNAFVDCWWGIMVGGGRDNTVRENLFVRCHLAMQLDARGLGWAASGLEGLRASLEKVPYKGEVWRRRYPGIERILDDDPMSPKGNTVGGNVLLGAGKDTDNVEPAFRSGSRVEGNKSKDGDWDVAANNNLLSIGQRATAELPPALRALAGRKFGPRNPVPGP